MKDKERIIVRDRRQKHQFSIHNRVIDEWLPVIGQTGYALYSLYVRMANQDDERCWPGYTLIKQHLNIGYSSISDYNKLLEWCGLIYIQRGDTTHPNEYYILNIPTATPERLAEIRQAAEEDLKEGNKFRATVMKRLEDWQPIQELWGYAGSSKPVIVHSAQMSLDLEGTPPAEHPSLVPEQGTPLAEDPGPVAEQGTPPAEDPSPVTEQGTPPAEDPSPATEQGTPPAEDPSPATEQGTPPAEDPDPVAERGTPPAEDGLRPQESNNPNQQSKQTIRKDNPNEQSTTTTPAAAASAAATAPPVSDKAGGVLVRLLTGFGVQEPVRSKIANNGSDVASAQAWIWYAQGQENLRDPTGFVVSRLLRHIPPPDDLLDLARVVQQLDADDREALDAYAELRRWDGRWWRLFSEKEGDERLAGLFTEELLEAWYTRAYRQPGGASGG